MKATLPLMIAAAASCGLAHGDIVYTTPMGYVSIACQPDSDTIVGVPLRQAADFTGTLASTPAGATLSLSGAPGLTVDEFAGTHYVKFKDSTPAAAGDGQWFTIASNTADSLTVDLGGRSLDAVAGAELEVLKLWTLGELFPPAECTPNAGDTGNAIVETTVPFAPTTKLLLPNLEATGINLPAASQYFVYNGAWRKLGDSLTVSHDAQSMWPDVYFVIRHSASVTAATTYTSSGEVEMDSFVIPLVTDTVEKQDNFVAVPRAVDLTLDDLNLGGTSAFDTSAVPFAPTDLLLLYDNASATINKPASATYFYYNGAWRKQGQSASTDFGSDVIPAGSGILIRKAPTAGGEILYWTNLPNY